MEKIFLFYTSLGKQLLSWQIVTVELNSDCEEDPLWWLPCAGAAAVPVVGKKRAGALACQWFTWAKSHFWFSCSLPVWPWQLAWPLSATQVPTGPDVMWAALPPDECPWGQVIRSPKRGLFFLFCKKNQLEDISEENSVSMMFHLGQTIAILEFARICSGSGFLHWWKVAQEKAEHLSSLSAQHKLFFVSPLLLFPCCTGVLFLSCKRKTSFVFFLL